MEAISSVPALTRLARAAALLVFIALALGLSAEAARADESAGSGAATGLAPELEQQVRKLALGSGGAAPAGVTRIEVVVGQLDPRLHLAPCQHVEPYLPDGTRLWGKSRIGLRCTQGVSKWNVYLPITVKVFGKALVATSGISSGAVLTAADLAQAEVDLAEDMSIPVTNA